MLAFWRAVVSTDATKFSPILGERCMGGCPPRPVVACVPSGELCCHGSPLSFGVCLQQRGRPRRRCSHARRICRPRSSGTSCVCGVSGGANLVTRGQRGQFRRVAGGAGGEALVAQNWTECRSSLHMGTPLRSLTVRCVSCGRSSGLVGTILVPTAVLCVVRARVWIWVHFRVQMAACSGRVARTQLPFGGVVSWRNRGVFGGPHDGTDGFGRRFWACSGRVLGASQRRRSRLVGCFLGEIGPFSALGGVFLQSARR